MASVFPMRNGIRHYDWGSPDWIPNLLSISNPEEKPYAELWMGAHSGLPSALHLPSGDTPLDMFIETSPENCLGSATAAAFGGRLPFLFKLLAAKRPLSIQAHPSLEQARIGWREENERGIPLNAYNRNYKDDNHKPELICALTDFRAMCGFRTTEEILSLSRQLNISALNDIIMDLQNCSEADFFKGLLSALLGMASGLRKAFAESAADRAKKLIDDGTRDNLVWETIRLLGKEYPDDPSIIAPIYLNVVQLRPGEGIYLPAGILHAYCEGFGAELMANSDNVLRGGLTSKFVDINELIGSLSLAPFEPRILRPENTDDSLLRKYDTPAGEFSLSAYEGAADNSRSSLRQGYPAVVLAIEGTLAANDGAGGSVSLKPGESAFVSAEAVAPFIEGPGRGFVATVNLDALMGSR